MVIPMLDLPPCAEYFSQHYQVPIVVIAAIRKKEGGWPGAVIGPNRNGTYDLGVMQINTIQWDERNPVNLRDFGITPERVRDDACTNIAVGTWIIRQNYDRFNDWWKAIAAYNAGPNNWPAGKRYAQDVVNIINELNASSTSR